MAVICSDIAFAKKHLQQGELVAIPTETVYGLAANAFNAKAVATIFEAKSRPTFDPLIVHTYSLEQVKSFTTDIHPKLLQLAQTYWPGPLTLLLPKKDLISDLVTSGLDKVGVRIPNHPLTLQLLQELDFSLAAPSANPFGYISPTTAQHVQNQLGDKIPYILDGGNCSVGLESTIVGEVNGDIYIYRLGGLTIDDIEQVVGKVHLQLNQSSNPIAPGQLKSHYAPIKPIFIGDLNELQYQNKGKKIGVLCFGEFNPIDKENVVVENLSTTQNFSEAAINLFSHLRELDSSNCDIIITNYLPNIHLGPAINDRLKRAASK